MIVCTVAALIWASQIWRNCNSERIKRKIIDCSSPHSPRDCDALEAVRVTSSVGNATVELEVEEGAARATG